MLLHHLLQQDPLGPIPAHEDIHPDAAPLPEPLATEPGQDLNHQVDPLPVDQPAADDDCDHPSPRTPGLARPEHDRVHGVRDDGHPVGRHGGPQHRVLLAGVRHADGVAGVGQGELQEGVRHHGARVAEAEQGMVGEDGGEAEEGGDHERLVGEGGEGGVAVDQGDSLGEEDVAEGGQGADDGRQHGLVVEGHDGQVEDLEEVGEVADADPVPVGVSDHQDTVAAGHQALG